MPAKLKVSYEKSEEIPEGYADLYAERNGHMELIGVEGMKTQQDIDKLQEAARKERELHKATKEKLDKFADVDPDALPGMLEELKEAQAKLATLTAEGKIDAAAIDERIQAAVNRAVGPVQRDKEGLARQLDAQKKVVAEKEAIVAKLEADKQQERIQNSIRNALLDAKVIPAAIEDAVLVGERMFELVDGKLVTRPDIGITPGLAPKEWAKDMQQSRPYWWPESVGGGAVGARAGIGSVKENPWSAEAWSLTNQGKVIKEKGEAVAADMAARVGSKIGATHPTKTT